MSLTVCIRTYVVGQITEYDNIYTHVDGSNDSIRLKDVPHWKYILLVLKRFTGDPHQSPLVNENLIQLALVAPFLHWFCVIQLLLLLQEPIEILACKPLIPPLLSIVVAHNVDVKIPVP